MLRQELEVVYASFRGRQFYGVDELTTGANEFVREFNLLSESEIEKLDSRTVRFYMSKDSGPLLTAGKRGKSFLFGYHELLKLIAIKWLSGQGVRLSFIKAALDEMDVAQLERAIGEPIKVFANRSEMEEFAESVGEKLEGNYVELRDPVARREFLDERERAQGKSVDGMWKRVILADGLELNVSSDFAGPKSREEVRKLVEDFEKALKERG